MADDGAFIDGVGAGRGGLRPFSAQSLALVVIPADSESLAWACLLVARATRPGGRGAKAASGSRNHKLQARYASAMSYCCVHRPASGMTNLKNYYYRERRCQRGSAESESPAYTVVASWPRCALRPSTLGSRSTLPVVLTLLSSIMIFEVGQATGTQVPQGELQFKLNFNWPSMSHHRDRNPAGRGRAAGPTSATARCDSEHRDLLRL